MKYFYTHLIEIESIIVELDKLDLSDDQRIHLTGLIDSSLHHTILDAVLSELKPVDKRIFLTHLQENDHSKIWKFLNEKVENIEDKIKKTAGNLKFGILFFQYLSFCRDFISCLLRDCVWGLISPAGRCLSINLKKILILTNLNSKFPHGGLKGDR